MSLRFTELSNERFFELRAEERIFWRSVSQRESQGVLISSSELWELWEWGWRKLDFFGIV